MYTRLGVFDHCPTVSSINRNSTASQRSRLRSSMQSNPAADPQACNTYSLPFTNVRPEGVRKCRLKRKSSVLPDSGSALASHTSYHYLRTSRVLPDSGSALASHTSLQSFINRFGASSQWHTVEYPNESQIARFDGVLQKYQTNIQAMALISVRMLKFVTPPLSSKTVGPAQSCLVR